MTGLVNQPVSERDPSEVPILLIVWRRPDTLLQVIEALRPVAPRQVFVACDGANPERPGEAEQVAATRAVIEQEIDWPCTIQRLYAETNLGCSRGPITAISWFFDHVEAGIILEDDCVPHPDFFIFCSVLLERYRHDSRVWSISGNNFQDGRWRGEASYYFSRYANCWGWATWRDRWLGYDKNLLSWPELKISGSLSSLYPDPLERRYWSALWERTYLCPDSVTWWDYQWQFQLSLCSALSVTPNMNLVINIGFGPQATHTILPQQKTISSVLQPLGLLRHPLVVHPNLAADRFLFYGFYLSGRTNRVKRCLNPFKSLLLRLRKSLFP